MPQPTPPEKKTPPAPTASKKRASGTADYLVEHRGIGVDTQEFSTADVVSWQSSTDEAIADSAAGRKWVRKNGVGDRMYRVVRVCWQGRITIEKKEVRKLA